ncbi:MAG: hypothetical protein K2J10_00740, partial [Muribaculaceae bacterium]|nr:hypothetical protein [Muribaculaceae bacterium]
MRKSILIVCAAVALLSSCGNNQKCSCGCGECSCEKDPAAIAAKAHRWRLYTSDAADDLTR